MDWRSGHTYPEDLRARVVAAMDGGGLTPSFERSPFRYGALARRGPTGIAKRLPKSRPRGAKLDDHLDALPAQTAELPIFPSSGRKPSVA